MKILNQLPTENSLIWNINGELLIIKFHKYLRCYVLARPNVAMTIEILYAMHLTQCNVCSYMISML